MAKAHLPTRPSASTPAPASSRAPSEDPVERARRLALTLFAVMQLIDDRRRVGYTLGQFAMRFLVFGIALSLAVPVSVWVTDQINAAYAESVSQQIDDAKTDSSAQAGLADPEAARP